MSDQGFGRNLLAVFGPGALYEGMGGKPLRSVTLNDEKDRVTFTFEDGSRAVFGVEGDCCSRSWIEHLTVPDGIAGSELVEIQDARIERLTDADHECLQVYKTTFRTAKGDIVLEYRNSSNGYYGGYLTRVETDDVDLGGEA